MMKDEEIGQADPSVRRYQRTYRWAGARLAGRRSKKNHPWLWGVIADRYT